MKRELRKDPELGGVPAHRLDTLSELKLVGRALYANIKQRGAVLASGEINPSVEAHRKNAHEQLCFFSAIADLKRAQIPEPTDIVALMAARLSPSLRNLAILIRAAAESICPTFVSSKSLSKR